MRHVHQWGPWLRGRVLYRRMTQRYRYCTNGWCPAGQYRNGRVFAARPERRTS